MKMKGDQTVQICIESKLEQESKWVKKSSKIVKSNKTIAQLAANGTIPQLGIGTTNKSINIVKNAIKRSIKEDVLDKWNNKVKQLTLQGVFTQLLM